MPMLVGLPGVSGNLPCQFVTSVTQALRRIQRRRAVTSAGDTGAINVWKDDKRKLRSEFQRHRQTLNAEEHADLESLSVWLNEWWPKMGREDEKEPT